jgi:hypothetical protein
MISILSFLQSCYAESGLKYYAPRTEQLTGVVKKLTFPGRPNYSSIKDGDEIETQAYLFLDQPFNVKMNLNDTKSALETYEAENNIRLVQIVMNASDYNQFKEGQRMTLKGKLTGATTGHHHAKVLIHASEWVILREKRTKPIKNFNNIICHSLLLHN